MPGIFATFALSSSVSVVSVSGSGPRMLIEMDGRSRASSSMPGIGPSACGSPSRGPSASALRLRALCELQVDARVVAALVGADRGHRELDLRESASAPPRPRCILLSVYRGSSHRRVEAQRNEALVRLRHELGADQRHHEEAADERDDRDRQHRMRCASAQPSTRRRRGALHSMTRSTRSMNRPSQGTRLKRVPAGRATPTTASGRA